MTFVALEMSPSITEGSSTGSQPSRQEGLGARRRRNEKTLAAEVSTTLGHQWTDRDLRFEDTMSKALFTLIRARRPATLTKSIRLQVDDLIAAPAANMVEGIATRMAVTDVEDFVRFIRSQAGHDWAICTGISAHAKARVYTKWELERIALSGADEAHPPAISRSKRHMRFMAGPALLALDYDLPKDVEVGLTAPELHRALCACCPWLGGVAMAIFASSSSYVYRSSTGEELKGAGGLHAYMIVDDGRHAPRITEAIFQATFEQFGFALITKSGAIYPRSLVDRSVPQPERLIFEAGVILSDGLEQRRAAPYLTVGGRLVVGAVPVLPEYNVWRETDPLWTARRIAAEPNATRVRAAWCAERLASGRISRATLERAVCDRHLEDDFQITLLSGATVWPATRLARSRKAQRHSTEGNGLPRLTGGEGELQYLTAAGSSI